MVEPCNLLTDLMNMRRTTAAGLVCNATRIQNLNGGRSGMGELVKLATNGGCQILWLGVGLSIALVWL